MMNKTIVFALIFTLFGFMAQAQYVNQTSAYSQEGVLNQVLYQDGSGNRALNVKIVDPATATRVTTAAYGIDSIFSQVAYADGTDYALGLIIRDLSLGSGTSMTDLTLTQGTITADAQVLSMTSTWNEGATTFTGVLLDVTDTASAANSLLMDLQVASSSVFSVDKDGDLIAAAMTGTTLSLTADSNQIVLDSDAGAGVTTTLTDSATAARVATLPDLTGTLAMVGVDNGAVTFQADAATFTGITFTGELTAGVRSLNVSNPPTDAELDAEFGTPAAVGAGFIGLVDDSDSNNMYRCYSDGTNWFTVAGVLAV